MNDSKATDPTRDSDRPVDPAEQRPYARLIFGAGVLLLALYIAQSYLVALTWAVLIAITAWPLYMRVAPASPQPKGLRIIAPLMVTLLTSVILLVPIAFILIAVGREAQTAIQWLTNVQKIGLPVPEWLTRIPFLGQTANGWWSSHLSDPQQAAQFLKDIDLGSLATWSQAFGGQLAHRALLVLIAFMALFFLFRDGEWIATRVLMIVDRWLGNPGDRLATKLVTTVRGTVNGTVLVALGEGILLTMGYFVTGVPHPVLFGALTIVFAMLPLGAWIAFGAAALVLLVQAGTPLMAISLLAFGAMVMLIGDNFVQPVLVGGAARLPFLWTLIGILGGLETFGLVGLFLGPVVMAAALTIWRDWIERRSETQDGRLREET
jgi:predicted PurR-regulated permease PerM